MMKKLVLFGLLVACLALPSVVWGGDAPADVSITASVDAFAEWADASPSIAADDWSGHITAVNQAQTVTKGLTLYANVQTTLTPTSGANSGILTNGTDVLTTEYQVTGDVSIPDAAWKLAGTSGGQFFNVGNTYTVPHTSGDGSYALNLLVQATSPSIRAPNSGDYTCGVTLTASW